MESIRIGTHAIPRLGLGTWQLDGDDALEVITTALQLGYRHIDTAQIYGNEHLVGEAVARSGLPRDQVFLTTKVWREHLAPGEVLRSVDESLAALRTDHVDLLLVHWPVAEVPLADTLQAFRQLHHAGQARLIGVSNFPPAQLAQACDLAPLACVQVEYHPLLDQDAILAAARHAGLVVTAYSPLARGEVLDHPVVREVAQRRGRSPAQVVLRWLLQQDRVAAIPKASSREHLADNLAVFDFELEPDDMAAISSLRGNHHRLVDPDFAPDWDAAAPADWFAGTAP